MLSLKNSSVRSKMLGSFALMFCLTSGLGLFSIDRLILVNNAADRIRTDVLPSTVALGELGTTMTRYRQLQASVMMVSAADRDAETQLLDEDRALVEKALARYQLTISPGAEVELAATINQQWAAYLSQSEKLASLTAANRSQDEAALYLGQMRETYKLLYKAVFDDMQLTLADGTTAANESVAAGAQGRTLIIGGMVLAALLCLAICYFLFRTVVQPVVLLTATMRRLANGDNAVDVPAVGRKDEIGAMAASVQVFKDSAIAKLLLEEEAQASRFRVEDQRRQTEAARQQVAHAQAEVFAAIGSGLESLSQGDLSTSLQSPFPEEYENIRANFNRATAELRQLIIGIVVNTGAIRSGTGELAQAADDLSQRTEQQAASLEQTAAALEEITATVRRTAEGAKQAGEVVSKARADAAQSETVVQGTVAAMSEIEHSARQISQIIGVIDEIAFQTSLLALNAGVEAARAGDAGRGFAVVAQEVRALAQRSAEAAKEIKALISTSTQQVGRGVDLVGETGRSLSRIIAQVTEINTAVTEIAHAANEQATGLAEVNTAITEMDRVTQQNAAMVQQSTAAVRILAQETEELVELTERFELGSAQPASPKSHPRRGRGLATSASSSDEQDRSADRPPSGDLSARKPVRPNTVVAMRVGGRTGAARKTKPDEQGWEEF